MEAAVCAAVGASVALGAAVGAAVTLGAIVEQQLGQL